MNYFIKINNKKFIIKSNINAKFTKRLSTKKSYLILLSNNRRRGI